jgi:hypothetical protein
LVATVALAATTSLTASAVVAAPAASASTVESSFVSRINAARAAAGVPALSVRSDLVAAARRHSATMADQGALSHSSLSGICCFRSLAENVGAGSTVAAVHAAFLGSSGHRANLLNPAMRHVGVGVVSSGGQLWVTEIFRAPSRATGTGPSATAAPQPDPTARSSTGARAARGTARRPPPFAAVLKVRLGSFTERRPATAGDPLASALRWASTMRTLTAPAP